jgi:hypothetical protein
MPRNGPPPVGPKPKLSAPPPPLRAAIRRMVESAPPAVVVVVVAGVAPDAKADALAAPGRRLRPPHRRSRPLA